jgi:tetratricopeptide (TPR) repeat protein
MSRRDPKKSKRKAAGASERMNQLKAKALAQVAGQAWSINQRHKTIALLTEALRREPTNTAILLQLATACGRQRYYQKAEDLLGRLLELAPRKAAVWRQAAQVYAAIDRPERAIECYRRCLELSREKAKRLPALLELAALYERRHELDQAEAAIAEALGIDATNEEGLFQQAMLKRRRGASSQAESLFKDLAHQASRSPAIRAQSWYELAHLWDDAGQYDDAFQALLSAKSLIKPFASAFLPENETTLLKTKQMVEELDRARYERWKAASEQDAPFRFAVLTGHPRSGTTLMEQVLDSHDQAISADEFDVMTHWIYLPIMSRFPITHSVLSILDRVPEAVRQQARAMYWERTEAIFNEPIGDRLLVDKNPAMSLILPVINWAFPDAKMLIALRDPRDVILSCFMQRLQPNPISVNWLTLSGAADFYVHSMQMWLAVREHTLGAWLEFRYEDVVADLAGQARRVLEFLGLPWDDKVLSFYEHAREKMVRSPTYQDVTRPVYSASIGKWQHYAKHLEPLLPKLQPFLAAFGYTP